MTRLPATEAAAPPQRPSAASPPAGAGTPPAALAVVEFDGAWYGSARFRAIGTDVHVLVTDPAAIAPALALTREYLDLLDAAASRFRPDSEVRRLARSRGDGAQRVSELLSDHVEAALHAARITGGLVDPTVGAAVAASGYDRDFAALPPAGVGAAPAEAGADVAGWTALGHDPSARTLRLPPGTLLDLGASAKAHAADVVAGFLAETLPGGFLVNLGGDVATSGTLPPAGWQVGVEAPDGRVLQTVSGDGQAFATSSTRLRRWEGPDGPRHHVVDPRTGRTAPDTWAQVTCAAATCLEANAASTAAIVLGEEAPAWLAERGVPARLDRADGRHTCTPGWPDPGVAA